MKVVITKQFSKDIKSVPKYIVKQILELVEFSETAEQVIDLFYEFDCIKIVWFQTFYRVRLWDYRVWFETKWSELHFLRILHRNEIYKKFP